MKYTKLFNQLNKEFGFTLDVAAEPHNARCTKYFTIKEDGLKQSWKGEVVWCHPPFGDRGIGNWVMKAKDECMENKVTSVLFLPASKKLLYDNFFIWGSQHYSVGSRSLPKIVSDVPQMSVPNPVMLLIFKPK